MDKQVLTDELTAFIGGYLSGQGLELVELILRYEGRDLFLRALVDTKEGGISIEECARINKELMVMLDEKNIVEGSYILEVSSPGLDRPLKSARDFARSLEKYAHFFLTQPVAGKIEVEGIIKKLEGNLLIVDIEDSPVEIPLDMIKFAKLIIE
jgi:ribosome maturation factor RimP